MDIIQFLAIIVSQTTNWHKDNRVFFRIITHRALNLWGTLDVSDGVQESLGNIDRINTINIVAANLFCNTAEQYVLHCYTVTGSAYRRTRVCSIWVFITITVYIEFIAFAFVIVTASLIHLSSIVTDVNITHLVQMCSVQNNCEDLKNTKLIPRCWWSPYGTMPHVAMNDSMPRGLRKTQSVYHRAKPVSI